MADHIKEIGKSSSAAMAGLVINGPVMFVIGVVLARTLGANGFGLYTLCLTIATLGSAVGTFGLHFGVFRYVAHYTALGNAGKARSAFNILTLAGIIGGVLAGAALFLCSELISDFFSKGGLRTALKIMAVLIPLLCAQEIFVFALRGLHKIPSQTAIEKVLQPLLRFGLFGLVLFMGHGLIGVLWSLVFGTAITALLAGWVVLNTLPKSDSRPPFDFREMRNWFTYSFPVFAEIVLKFLLLQAGIEVFILGKFVSEADIGIYGAAYRVLPLMMVPALAFSSAFGPIVAECFAKKDIDELRKMFSLVNRLIVILTIPLFIGLICFSWKILAFFGPGFDAGAVPLAILAIGFLIDAGVGEVRTIVLLSGRSGIYLFNSVVLVTMSIILSLLFVPMWGILGAAIAAACSRAAFNLMGILQVFYFTRIHPFTAAYFKIWVAGALLLGVFLICKYLFALDMASYITAILIYGILMIIYTTFIFLFLDLSEEKEVFWSVVKRNTKPISQPFEG